MDYVQDHLERTAQVVPDPTWEAAVAIADEPDFDVAASAYRLGRADIARRLFAQRAQRDPRAGLMLGWLLADQRDLPAARAAFQEVIDGSDDPWRTGGKHWLAATVLPDDDPAAITLLNDSVVSGAPMAAAAAGELGRRLEEMSRFVEARAAWERVLAFGDQADLDTAERPPCAWPGS